MRELPGGTVTFLFTDVEGSTRLLDELGTEAYAEALAQHRRLLRHGELGRTSEAEASAQESLRIMDEIGDRQMMVFALARLARIAAETGREERAGLLWGAIEAEEERSRMGAWAKERDRLGAPVLAHSGSEFARGREKGRKMALEDAVGLALDETDGRASPERYSTVSRGT